MKSDLGCLYPSIYRGVREIDALASIGDVQFNQYFGEMDQARSNQFAGTADTVGIDAMERIYGIRANPATESLNFRRQRLLGRMQLKVPFTFHFLRQRLDEVIGIGKYRAWLSRGQWNNHLGSWRLGQTPFREHPYTLYVSTVAENVDWYQEIQVFVNKIKPAAIVFAINPYLVHGIGMGEEIGAFLTRYHYTLGTWQLNGRPFKKEFEREVVKVPQNSSISTGVLEEHARLTIALVTMVRLNGSTVLADIQKVVADNTATIRYIVTPELGLTEITLIELLGEGGEVKSKSHVFIPVPSASQLILEHNISHEEMK